MASAADTWGADWIPEGRGGRLGLPVMAGLRRGMAHVRIDTWEQGSATRVTASELERRDGLHLAAVFILLFAGAGALLTVVWPFFPVLLPAAPLGAVLALSGWFLVVSRLQTSGPDEFLDLVASMAAEAVPVPAGDGGAAAAGEE